MKTCNGCKYLYIGDDGFNPEWWCSYYDKGLKICRMDGYTVKEVPTPYWCPKEAKNENV